jgi:hypothetical protein
MSKADIAKAEQDFKAELAKLDEQRPTEVGRHEQAKPVISSIKERQRFGTGTSEVSDGRAPPYKVQQPGRKQQPVKSEDMY